MSTNYLEELNESQRAAVLYTDGASLVIAGAGSGKTRVLTYKIAYLLESGYAPWSILALTFTNKAAREMKERIARQVGTQTARRLWMGTFHSVFSRILRTEAAAIGFPAAFTVYDSSDSKSLIKSIIREMGLDDKVYKAGTVQARISRAKNRLVDPPAYAADRETVQQDMSSKMPAIREIYARYWERCRQAGAMDFDDLLFYTYLLFKDHPEILAKYSNQFRYVLVDEYQDTNYAQHQIVLQLSREHEKVCVVGDDAQSIYSFRGANIDNILNFTGLYRDAKIFKLERNYRSTRNLVSAANSLIEKNREQIRKEVYSEKENGEPVVVNQAYSDVEEGDIVANKIQELHRRGGYGYEEFAVLYRTNAQSRVFEEALRKRTLPYKIYGGLSFYQRKEIKDVIAYFRLAVNPSDEEAFKRVINYPARGIGETTLGKIIAAATAHSVSLWDVICSPPDFGLNLNKGTLTKIQGFRELIDEFIAGSGTKDAYELGTLIVRQSGIINEIYQDKTPENLSRQENIEELVNGMHDFCASRLEEGNRNLSLSDYLSEISLLTDQDSDKEEDRERITLMTIHAAKGLEFKVVFVVGLEENLFPSAMSLNSYRELEEERRLFYVAITRAEEHCFLSYAKSRFRYGKMEFGNPSRFLKDIDVQFLRLPQEAEESRRIEETAARIRGEQSRRSLFSSLGKSSEESREERTRPAPPPKFAKIVRATGAPVAKEGPSPVEPGQTIEHERFGLGEVIKVEGTGENCKATVRFRNAGEKQLLLKFARFTIVG